mmetsp:Transcript_23741/g.51871  ORF Transcript_23741/g.51871 Transcript_23741/m.51871 type:complete len:92 (-) Transcript_23741:115-390(-)
MGRRDDWDGDTDQHGAKCEWKGAEHGKLTDRTGASLDSIGHVVVFLDVFPSQEGRKEAHEVVMGQVEGGPGECREQNKIQNRESSRRKEQQ